MSAHGTKRKCCRLGFMSAISAEPDFSGWPGLGYSCDRLSSPAICGREAPQTTYTFLLGVISPRDPGRSTPLGQRYSSRPGQAGLRWSRSAGPIGQRWGDPTDGGDSGCGRALNGFRSPDNPVTQGQIKDVVLNYAGVKSPELLDAARFVLVQASRLSALELDRKTCRSCKRPNRQPLTLTYSATGPIES
jgi:hypothetical protein